MSLLVFGYIPLYWTSNFYLTNMKKVILVSLTIAFCSAVNAQDQKYEKTLKKMFKLAGTEQTFSTVIDQMFGMIKGQYANIDDEYWKKFKAEFSKTSLEELTEMLVPVYRKHLTQSNLEEIIEFYESPVGKKYAQKTPMIMQESMQIGQQWGMQIGQKIKAKLEEKGY